MTLRLRRGDAEVMAERYYRITVRGVLTDRLAAAFEPLRPAASDGLTVLSGVCRDPARAGRVLDVMDPLSPLTLAGEVLRTMLAAWPVRRFDARRDALVAMSRRRVAYPRAVGSAQRATGDRRDHALLTRGLSGPPTVPYPPQ